MSTGIEADVRRLRGQVARRLMDASLGDAALRGRIATLEAVIQLARQVPEAGGAPDLTALRQDLLQVRQTLTQRRAPDVGGLGAPLADREARRAALLQAWDQRQQVRQDGLAALLSQLNAQLSGLETAVGEMPARAIPHGGVIPQPEVPVRAGEPGLVSPAPALEERPAGPSPEPGRRIARLLNIAGAVALVALAGVLLYPRLQPGPGSPARPVAQRRGEVPVRASASSEAPSSDTVAEEEDSVSSEPAPEPESSVRDSSSGESASPVDDLAEDAASAAASAWPALWEQALVQPVSSCRGNAGATTFLACACPDVRPLASVGVPVEGSGARCQPDERWPPALLIGAVQAVLRVRQPDVWIDGEPGADLSGALERVNARCVLPDEVDAARELLARRRAALGEDGGPTAAAGAAALLLLRHLEHNPRCAG